MADSKPKKRLIAASSDEDEEAGLPLSKRVKAEPSDSPPVNNEQAGASQSGATNGQDSAQPATAEVPHHGNGDTDMAGPPKDTQSAQAAPQSQNGHGSAAQENNNESSEDEAPLLSKVEEASRKAANSKRPQKKAAPRKRNAGADSSDLSDPEGGADNESDFEDDKPLKAAAGKKKAPAKKPAAQPRKSKAAAAAGESTAKAPASKAKASGAASKKVKKENTPAASSPVKKAKKEEDGDQSGGEGDDEDDEHKFAFLNGGEDTGEKWQTLEHSGVIFPPEYEPLPEDVKLYYDGKAVDLPHEAEEVAGFFAAMLDTDHAQKPVFRENFFKDFLSVLEEHPPLNDVHITDFDKCDFRPMADWFDADRQRKKNIPQAEKKRMKAEKDAAEEKYKTCKLNGKLEKVGNFRIEPPALFRGRGAHPKTGKLKLRVQPEQITLNIGKGVPIPEPPAGHQWGSVQHDNTVSWLAMWKENINNAFKYVFLAAGSSLKGESDFKKYEKARKLKHYIDGIRAEYESQLKEKVMATRQRATAVYLIDRFALRAGNEKGDDEAETVGCCSLKCSNITLMPPRTVQFDFLGKDSIRFLQSYEVDEQVFKNLRIFKKDKTEEAEVFDRLNTTILNNYLRQHMEGLSAKVFRTYNASWTFQQELEKRTNPDDSIPDKILSYNRANRDVAVLCNHQRSVAKTHAASMDKLRDKLRGIKYQRRKLRFALFHLEDVDKKILKQYEEDESDIDDEWIAEHEENLRELAKERARKRFERDQVKAEEDEKSGVAKAEESQSPEKKPAAASKKSVKKEESDEETDEKPQPKRGRGAASKAKKEDSDDEEEEDVKPKKGKGRASKAKKEETEDEDVKPKGGRKPKYLTEEGLEKLLEQADEDFKKNREETKTKIVETNKDADKLVKELEKKDQQIAANRSTILDRDEGKEVSLGTSKINYIDPRLTFAWCKKYDVPVEKLFAKTLREKFAWAASAPPDFVF